MVVDSSVWLEILREGRLSAKCEKAMARQPIQVPALVLFEVFKKLKLKASEDLALEAITALSRHQILELTREVALLGADLSIEHELAMADSLVLAHAYQQGTELLTLDNDFSSIANVMVIR